MKSKIINQITKIGWILPIAAILTIGACKKNNYLGYTPGTGAPTISSVHTLSKQDTTIRYDTVISYDASGNPVMTLKQLPFPYNPFDSTTTAGNLGNYYVIEGTNLGNATSVTFNGVPAFLNRAWNTDKSIVIAIPGNTPATGPRATDSLTVTTVNGVVSYKFAIIAPPPMVAAYSSLDFTSTGGFQMTLTGVGFASVTSLVVQDTVTGQTGTATVNILSQNDSVMVLSFQPSTINRGILVFTYTAAGATTTAKGSQELVNLDNAYQIFANGAFGSGWGDWSYDQGAGVTGISTTQAINAPASYLLSFAGNGYKVEGFRDGNTAADGVPYSNFTYLVFYVFGGTAQETMYVEFGGGAGSGFANNNVTNAINPVTVLPGVWNYFKIPISTLIWNAGPGNWAANSSLNMSMCGFFIYQNTIKEQLYFDDVVLVK